jgi:hypothetical protein
MEITYVLPLKSREPIEPETARYMSWLGRRLDQVIVVDGSDPGIYETTKECLRGTGVQHVRPLEGFAFTNGKVGGVHTGLALARNEHVIVADDDIRYETESLTQVDRRLAQADLVWPQCYFEPRPWHARWDTARSLMNRAVHHDYPGTVGVRSTAFVEVGGYEGDVLFENLQLLRAFRRAGRTVDIASDLYVRRKPPGVSVFLSQRVRQAYDSLASPARFAAELAILPLTVGGCLTKRWGPLIAGATSAVVAAEVGRRRFGGRSVYRATDPLWTPMWLIERGLCSWIALGNRVLRGGIRYSDAKIRDAAT